MNKKGTKVFLPILVILTLVILTAMAFTIKQTNIQRELEPTGAQAAAIFKIYDEAEKVHLYLEKSSNFAVQNTLNTLDKQGGFANTCGTGKFATPGSTGYTLINNCESVNPSEEFEKALKQELKKYTQSYKSTYVLEDLAGTTKLLQSLGIIPETVEAEQQRNHENAIQNLNLNSIEETSETITLHFEDLSLPIPVFNKPTVDATKRGKHTLPLHFNLEKPDLSPFREIYKILDSCNAFEDCQRDLESSFPGSSISLVSNIFKIDLKQEGRTIRLAYDPSQPLPKFTESTFTIS